MLLHRVRERAAAVNWFAVAIDLAIVILGIFIGLQANLWLQDRQERATERRYLERLRADSDANVLALRQAVTVNERRAATFTSLAAALDNGGPAPGQAALSDAMCRWFVQPSVNVQRGTYTELVSSGRLALLRDEELRGRLALEQAAHDEAERLDIIAPAIFQATAPLADHREWRIAADARHGVNCQFDVAGMRADSRIASMVTQLYRHEILHKEFRERELAAVRATGARLNELLGR